jgi:hypothetical protein
MNLYVGSCGAQVDCNLPVHVADLERVPMRVLNHVASGNELLHDQIRRWMSTHFVEHHNIFAQHAL